MNFAFYRHDRSPFLVLKSEGTLGSAGDEATMELTVIREGDQRRMVVAVEASSEGDALRTIQNAIGPVSLAREQLVTRGRRSVLAAERHARHSPYF